VDGLSYSGARLVSLSSLICAGILEPR
jgi:hypothetical protein